MNPGSTPLSIASIKLTAGINYPSSTISHDFQQTNNCPTPIPAGGSCVFTITFTPTTTGRIDAYLVVDLGVSNGASRSWLEGYGVGFTPSSLTFPSQTVGTTSASQTIALGGVGSTIFVSSITVSGDFQQSSCGAFPIRIDPYQTCTITVTFTPTVIGTQANMLTATDSYGVQGGPQRATLTGTGQ